MFDGSASLIVFGHWSEYCISQTGFLVLLYKDDMLFFLHKTMNLTVIQRLPQIKKE
jgi:hypothetical protein